MKIIVAGEGAFGRKHLAALKNIDGIEIVSLAGGVAEATASVAAAHDIPHWSLDLAECLEQPNVEAAILVTPTPMHADQAMQVMDAGYQHFDSARLYGFGANEALLSRVIKMRRDEMFITSKCGIEFQDGPRRLDASPDAITRAVDKSLRAFGTDYIDLYYLHRLDPKTPIEESVSKLEDLRKAGKIGGIGLSEMSENTLRRAASETRIDAMQSEYSLWTRNPEIGVLEACKALGTAFIAFSPLSRGVLAGSVIDPEVIPEGDLRLKMPRFDAANWPKNFVLAQKFNVLANEAGVTPAQLSLRWVLSRGEHVHVIPGTKSIDHMRENFAAMAVNISDEALKKAGELINHQSVSGHRYPVAARVAIDTEEFEKTS